MIAQKLKVQYISDVHLETRADAPHIPRVAPILALCGDIGPPSLPKVREWIGDCAKRFDKVLWVPGNHEYYNKPYIHTMYDFDTLEKEHRNLKVMRNDRVDIGNVTFLGTTLWSQIDPSIAKYINDYKQIRMDEVTPFTVQDSLGMHRRALDFLDDEISQAAVDGRKVVVLSHHAPDMRMNGKYLGSGCNSAFATNLTYLMRNPVEVWINGHTHENLELYVNNVKCIANCLGYDDENTGGRLDATLDV